MSTAFASSGSLFGSTLGGNVKIKDHFLVLPLAHTSDWMVFSLLRYNYCKAQNRTGTVQCSEQEIS